MDGQRARFAIRTLDRVPTIRRLAHDDGRRRWAPGGLHPMWAAVLGVGWSLAILVGMSIQPAAADPQAAAPTIAMLADWALFAGLVATAVAAGQRHPAALLTGLGTGLIAAAMVISCPATGHHTIGAWWYAQLGLVAAMLGVNLVAFGRRSRAPA